MIGSDLIEVKQMMLGNIWWEEGEKVGEREWQLKWKAGGWTEDTGCVEVLKVIRTERKKNRWVVKWRDGRGEAVRVTGRKVENENNS